MKSRYPLEANLSHARARIRVILATDCGSTTSKARLFKRIGNEYRFIAAGEAPTTVETPYEDVTLGVKNAIMEIEELTGHKILSDEGVMTPHREKNVGVDLYVTTSSAGGGLQMMVSGVVKIITAESAERAALGAGAIVMDVMAVDDGRQPYQKTKKIRNLRPDMILIAGGTDGGAIEHVIKATNLVVSSDPKPRLGVMYKLPIVYAGNKDLRGILKKTFCEKFALKIVDNIRPRLEVENIGPARDAIHEFFMEHVMSHAPGYDKLMRWTEVPIMPTPMGEGMMIQTLAKMGDTNVIGVGLGGATTNIYSVFEGKFIRTVSANLGMSYSICNVLKQAGTENIMRWMPFEIDSSDLRDRLYNKMIRPTTLPQTINDLLIEHSVAREALRLAFIQHKQLARGLRGIKKDEDAAWADLFAAEGKDISRTYIEMMKISLIAGTGGLLSHAPRRVQAALMLIDGFQPEGVTQLGVDSIFMMPHLGVLSTVYPKVALEIFKRDCLVRLGTCIAPTGQAKEGNVVLEVKLRMPDEREVTEKIPFGTIKVIPLKEGERANAEIDPSRGFDVGRGENKTLKTIIEGGVVGIIIDARGRPLTLPEDEDRRREKLIKWFTSTNAYPKVRFKETPEKVEGKG